MPNKHDICIEPETHVSLYEATDFIILFTY